MGLACPGSHGLPQAAARCGGEGADVEPKARSPPKVFEDRPKTLAFHPFPFFLPFSMRFMLFLHFIFFFHLEARVRDAARLLRAPGAERALRGPSAAAAAGPAHLPRAPQGAQGAAAARRGGSAEAFELRGAGAARPWG